MFYRGLVRSKGSCPEDSTGRLRISFGRSMGIGQGGHTWFWRIINMLRCKPKLMSMIGIRKREVLKEKNKIQKICR